MKTYTDKDGIEYVTQEVSEQLTFGNCCRGCVFDTDGNDAACSAAPLCVDDKSELIWVIKV